MTSMPTNGMPSWGGGLPPQAPTSSRQLHHASHAHHRANSADIIDASSSANPTSSKPSSSSQRRHKSRSGRSGRTRSSSDGVKMMKEQYHQQLQHQQLQHQQMQQQLQLIQQHQSCLDLSHAAQHPFTQTHRVLLATS